MSSPYATTTVSVAKSQDDLRDMLRRYGATRFSFTEDDEYVEVAFRHSGLAVRMRVPYQALDELEARQRARRSRTKTFEAIVEEFVEQEHRRLWRVLFWLLKTRMEAIAAGVETFAEAFLPHLVDPRTDTTVFEALSENGVMRQLEAGE